MVSLRSSANATNAPFFFISSYDRVGNACSSQMKIGTVFGNENVVKKRNWKTEGVEIMGMEERIFMERTKMPLYFVLNNLFNM